MKTERMEVYKKRQKRVKQKKKYIRVRENEIDKKYREEKVRK